VKQKLPLDWETHRKITTEVDRTNHNGMDISEALHRAGLILSPAVRLDLQKSILGHLADSISTWQPHEMMRRYIKTGTPGTPADMFAAMLDYINDYKDLLKE
jgi:hypothetical protein